MKKKTLKGVSGLVRILHLVVLVCGLCSRHSNAPGYEAWKSSDKNDIHKTYHTD